MSSHAPDLRGWVAHLRRVAGPTGAHGPRPPVEAWGAADLRRSPAAELWRVLDDPPTAWRDRVAQISGLRWSGEGPLLESSTSDAVEVWVDSELSVLHAAQRMERVLGDPVLHARIASAIRWHLEFTGTENATHRPWAIHAFLLHGTPEARFFAEGQLHALETHGPDATSRWILRDAAEELAHAAEGGRGVGAITVRG